jgi:diguanylate cyclase (GGDEF)-like protein
MSYHDQLTGLYNRHYFEHAKKELKELPVISVIMTDINGLKLINDTYGHEAGDELLKEYARILKESFKKSDLIFRWGGDEFVVVLKNTAEATSWELCNRLVRRCGETLVRDIPLSISVGISSKLEGENIDLAFPEAENMMYKNKLTESKSSKNLIMKTLLQTLSEKSFETKEHIERMSDIGKRLGLSLDLPPSELSRLSTLIMLHDIGKINIDSHILLKRTALDEDEWAEINKHPEVGYRITRTAEEFAYVAEEILSHHERWDGLGYPQGLAGDSIPYLSRILALIDSYDVMRNGRPYKRKMKIEEIIEEIEKCSGKQFDPELARKFIMFILNEDSEQQKNRVHKKA